MGGGDLNPGTPTVTARDLWGIVAAIRTIGGKTIGHEANDMES